MSTLKATIEQVEILPHPNADALELARVGEYRAVVPKGQYASGQFILYIPEQAVLPEGLIEELGLEGKLAGKKKDRVKAVKLRGELSQGIVCRPAALAEIAAGEPLASLVGQDFAPELGIEKWVPEIPQSLSGEVESDADLIRWIEVENIKRYPDMFVFGEDVCVSEKIHGTACLLTWVAKDQKLLVSSKGLGGRNLVLKEAEGNAYWRAVNKFGLRDKLTEMCDMWDAEVVAIFGEVYGKGIQDLTYDTDLGFAAFDLWTKLPTQEGGFIDSKYAYDLMYDIDLPHVPILFRGSYDYQAISEMASGTEQVSKKEGHIREGVVVRPEVEGYSEQVGGRKIAKFISPNYLLRKGDTTEYE